MTDALAQAPDPGTIDRTRIRRLPEKSVADRDRLYAVLDAGLVAHVAVADPGTATRPSSPIAIPVAYARNGDSVLFHGSTGSRLFRLCAAGVPVCLTVTRLDGLVLARSAFESSMNYRSALVLGHCSVLHGSLKLAALERISEHLMPGRWKEVRQPSAQELRATAVLELPLDECSVKVSDGMPDDPDEDLDVPVWAGVVPLTESWSTPVAAPDLSAEFASVPEYIRAWQR